MRILFIEPYPTEGPSSRYRVEQYLPHLRDSGIECVVRPFVSARFYRILYKKGLYFQKALFFLESSFRRALDILTAARSDIVFIHLESFPFGPPLFERLFHVMGKKIIYDLDDAIYLGITSPANKFLKYLKSPDKIREIIKISSHVITCNSYLGDYARRYNRNVTVIHTSVDTERFSPVRGAAPARLTIGWIGSHSTARYLDGLAGVMRKLSARYSFNLKIVGAGDYRMKIPGADVINKPWELSNEVDDFRSIDIGVYPLPDNEWTRGKTGFKTIQYMSVGIPCVVSNTGANKNIVRDGINGYLADTEDEWIDRISLLIENAGLRKKIGDAGRKTVEESFSVKANVPEYMRIIRKVSE